MTMSAQQRATKRQQELLTFVDGFIREHGYGPSYREIMNGIGYKSVSTVAVHIEGLIAKGFLSRKDNSARSLEVVGMTPLEVKKADELLERLQKVHTEAETDHDKAAISRTMELLGYEKQTKSLATDA